MHKGRIWRIVHESARPGPAPALSKETSAQLVARLSHPNGWWRDTAQQLLVQRGDASVVGALTRLVDTAPDVRTSIHALWTLDGLDRIDAATVTRALDHPSRDLRVAAIRVSERWLTEPSHPIHAAVLKQHRRCRLGRAPAVGSVAWRAAGRSSACRRWRALLERHGQDPMVMDAALSGLRGVEPAVLDRLLQASGTVARRGKLPSSCSMATIVRGAQDEAVGCRAGEDC